MILTAESYHSLEARREYLTASRYKDFCGSLGLVGCEARALAMASGEYVEEPSLPMMESSYVDAHFSGNLELFKAVNPQMFSSRGPTKGALKSVFKQAYVVIARIEADPYMMKCLSGEKQVIMTGELFGAQWSIMIDSYIPDVGIFDLKVMANLRKSYFVADWGRMDFVRYYGYLEQAAIYQKIVAINTGKVLPFCIVAASKERVPDIEVIGFEQSDLDQILFEIEDNAKRINQVRLGEVEPRKCGRCDFCRALKVITGPLHYQKLLEV